jgi:hypothetical protein
VFGSLHITCTASAHENLLLCSGLVAWTSVLSLSLRMQKRTKMLHVDKRKLRSFLTDLACSNHMCKIVVTSRQPNLFFPHEQGSLSLSSPIKTMGGYSTISYMQCNRNNSRSYQSKALLSLYQPLQATKHNSEKRFCI